jgi:hypothetical protein
MLYDFNAPVLRTAQAGVVAGDRFARAKSLGGKPRLNYVGLDKIGLDGRRL